MTNTTCWASHWWRAPGMSAQADTQQHGTLTGH